VEKSQWEFVLRDSPAAIAFLCEVAEAVAELESAREPEGKGAELCAA